MAGGRPLPQFRPADLATGRLIDKLRALVRALELQEPSAVTAGSSAPAEVGVASTTGTGTFRIDPASAVVWYDTGAHLAPIGVLLNAIHGQGLIEVVRDGATFIIRLPVLDAAKSPLTLRHPDALPNEAKLGEPLLSLASGALYYGTGAGVEPLRIAPANVIDLLDSTGLIAEQWLPAAQEAGSTRPVYVVSSTAQLFGIDPEAGAIGLVQQSGSGFAGYVHDGVQWLELAGAAPAAMEHAYLMDEDYSLLMNEDYTIFEGAA